MLSSLSKFLRVTGLHLVAALVLGIFIFFAEFLPVIFRILSQDGQSGSDYAQQTFSQYVSAFLSNLNDLPFAQSLITGLTWAAAGLALYVLYLVFANILIDARNEITVGLEDSQKGVTRSKILKHASAKLTASVGYFAFSAVSLTLLVGYWIDLMRIFVYSSMSISEIPSLVFGLSGLILNIYLLFSLAYLIWRYEGTV